MVLLAVMNGASVIIDPKSGGRILDAKVLPDKQCLGLGWQQFLDTTNCGFYVYHMVTTAIMASLNGEFKIGDGGSSLGSNLVKFFEGRKEPHKPADIHNGMRQILEKTSSMPIRTL